MANFTSNPYFGYSDLLNTFSMSAVDSMNVNNIVVNGTANFPNIPANSFVGTDNSNNLVNKGITGTINQIIINSGVNGVTLSTPQDINTTSNVTFNSAVLQGATIIGLTGSTATFDDLRLTNLTPSEFLGVDSSKRLVARGISGKNNQINISYGVNGITLTTPQDIATTSNVQFNTAILQGATISSINTASIESTSNTLNIGSNSSTNTVNLACSTGVQTVNIGLGGLAQTNINIGGANDYVTIAGTLTYINTDDLKINDKNIFLNSGGTTATSYGSGMIFEVTGTTYAGYIRQDTLNGNKFIMKPTNNPYILSTPILTGNADVITTTEAQTITALKTFTAGITTNSIISGSDTTNTLSVVNNSTLSGTVSVGRGYNDCNLQIRGGADAYGGLYYASKQLEFRYDHPNGSLSHFVRSRHNGASSPLDNNSNAIDFFLYNSGSNLSGSTFPGVGNKLSATITAIGIGVGITYPSYNLDVLGNGRFSNGITTTTYIGTTATITNINTTTLTATGATVGTIQVGNLYGLLVSGSTLIGITTSTQDLIIRGSTSSKLLRIDANNKVVSSLYDEISLVRTDGEQTISGNKTFNNAVIVNNLAINGAMIGQPTPNTLLTLNGTSVQSCSVSKINSNDSVVMRDSSSNIYVSGITTSNIVVSGATANKYAYFDSNKNLVAVNDPASNLLASNNNWSGLNTFANITTFTANPFIYNTGQASLRLSGATSAGFSIYSNGQVSGLQVMDLSTSQNLLSLRNPTSINKLLITDASNYMASSTLGESDLVLTTGNQNISGNKTITYNNKLIFGGGFGDSLNIQMNSATSGLGAVYTLIKDTSHIFRANNSTTNSLTITANGVYTKNNTLDDGSGNVNIPNLTASKLVLTDGSKNLASSSYGISDVTLLGVTQTITAKKTFSDLEVSNFYNFKYWASFTVTSGTANQTLSGNQKVQWNSSAEQAGSSAFTISSNTDINVPTVGLYLVQWNRRVTNAFTGENDIYVRTDINSNYYGLQQIPASAYYVSCSAIVPITSLPAKIWAGCYAQNNNLTLDNTNSIYNRLTIYLMSSAGTII